MNQKKLGFGMMRLPLTDPNNAAAIDIEQTKKMVDLFLEKGFTYFDTAWMYHDFQSESAVKEVLVDRYPRDRYTLATKLHAGFIETKEDRDKIFEAQKAKTGVSYFDYYMLHGIEVESYEKYEKLACFEWLMEKKANGDVKHAGISYHADAELLDRILTRHPDLDFVQLQLNYLDWENDGIQSRKCYEVVTKHNIPVIVMEPVKGGTLANVPESVSALYQKANPDMSVASWAVRYAASLANVKMVLSGMSSLEQMEDNLSYMQDFTPLEEKEYAVIAKAVELINSSVAIPCTSCSYCTEGCPKSIPIPKYFSLYNANLQEVDGKSWLPQEQYYLNLTKDFGKASDCIACGQCESMCPQHLPIIENLKTVAAHFEKET